MTTLHLDFETRSTVDLRKSGVYIYAGHPTTDIWCAAYAFDDDPIKLWALGEPIPDEVASHVICGEPVMAHNASFEWALWNGCGVRKYDWPELDIEQCYCTAAMAAAMSLPRALADAAAAVGLPVEKDMAGHRLMMQMCRPRKIEEDGTIIWWDEPDKLRRLYDYCKTDVEVERQLEKRIMPLPPQERKIYLLDHVINTRGVALDMPLVSKAQLMVQEAQKPIGKELRKLTDGAVTGGTQVQQIVKWLKTRMIDTPSIDKEHILDLLEEDLPDDVERVLRLRQESAKASNAKLTAMQNAVSGDGRVRSMFLYHGASTGRWSGARVQLHNMPRPDLKYDEIEEAIPYIMENESEMLRMLYGSPINVVSSCLRSMLLAGPGNKLVTADFSNIEGRGLAWLAGQNDLVDFFKNDGPVYERMGAAIFGQTTEEVLAKGKDCLERDLGKRATLGCGYGMGAKKFKGTCKREGNLRIEMELAERAVKTWRSQNSLIVDYWSELEAAAIEATLHSGRDVEARLIRFKKIGSFLWCRLPSSRALCYPYPRTYYQVWVEYKNGVKTTMPVEEAKRRTDVEINSEPFLGLKYRGVNSLTKKWGDIRTYGGMLAENVTQAVARDVLAEAMVRVEEAGYPVVIHVHDEIGSEVPKNFGSVEEFEALLGVLPDWACGYQGMPDYPIKAEGWEGERYRK